MADSDKPLTLGDFQRLMAEHEENEKRNNDEQLERFMSGFPNGDPVPHREFHEAKIRAAQAEQRFWETAQAKVIEKGIEGIFGALKIVVLLALTGIAFKLGIPFPFFGGK